MVPEDSSLRSLPRRRQDTDGCDCANPRGGCLAHKARGSGQSCLWFSQGCSINCKSCTGENGHSSTSVTWLQLYN